MGTLYRLLNKAITVSLLPCLLTVFLLAGPALQL